MQDSLGNEAYVSHAGVVLIHHRLDDSHATFLDLQALLVGAAEGETSNAWRETWICLFQVPMYRCI